MLVHIHTHKLCSIYVCGVRWHASLPLFFTRCLHLSPSLAFRAHIRLFLFPVYFLFFDVLTRWRKITFCSCRSWKGIGPETSPGIKASCFVSPPLHSTGEFSSSSSSSTFTSFISFLLLDFLRLPPWDWKSCPEQKYVGENGKWERFISPFVWLTGFRDWSFSAFLNHHKSSFLSCPFPVLSCHVSPYYFYHSQALTFICSTWAPVRLIHMWRPGHTECKLRNVSNRLTSGDQRVNFLQQNPTRNSLICRFWVFW